MGGRGHGVGQYGHLVRRGERDGSKIMGPCMVIKGVGESQGCGGKMGLFNLRVDEGKMTSPAGVGGVSEMGPLGYGWGGIMGTGG